MFDKKEYKHRRELGLRGQVIAVGKTITAKGHTILHFNREGKEVAFPNDSGHTVRFGQILNRKEARQKVKPGKDTTAAVKRKEARAARAQKRNSGEHERATKKAGK